MCDGLKAPEPELQAREHRGSVLVNTGDTLSGHVLAVVVLRAHFRVPDGGLHRPGATGVWHATAAMVVEVRFPGDETWHKLPFYAAHHVDEVLIVDPAEQTVTWLGLRGGEYEPVGQSGLIELGPTKLAAQVDWP